MAKNKIKRCLVAVIDPHPSKTEKDGLWEYFDSKCAYCGEAIERKSRIGHLDHVLAAAEGGSNNIHNFVLSCAKCNGDEKREENWDSFLKKKSKDEYIFKARHKKISEWIAKQPLNSAVLDKIAEAEKIIETALLNFDDSVKRMRELRDSRN